MVRSGGCVNELLDSGIDSLLGYAAGILSGLVLCDVIRRLRGGGS